MITVLFTLGELGLGEMEQNCNMITPEPLETSSQNCQSIILYGGKGG